MPKALWMRRVTQALFFIFFTYLIYITAYPLDSQIPVDVLLRFDPLIALVTFLTGHAVITKMLWAFLLLAAVVIIGNFFCGWVCPLGALLDVSDFIIYRRNRNTKADICRSRAKYYILAVVVGASLFSYQLLYLLDPLSLITRTAVISFFPPIIYLINLGRHLLHQISPSTMLSDIPLPIFKVNLFIFSLFLLIILAGLIRRRFWCRYLCPLGALLSLSSRFRLVQRRTDECLDCSPCQGTCPMGAIKEDAKDYSASDCILCLRCTVRCNPGMVTFGFAKPHQQKGQLDLSKRYFMGAAVAGAFSAVVIKTNPMQTESTKVNTRLLRPPAAALPENRFISLCMGCGECLKVCPNNALQSTFLEAGLAGMFTPRMVPRIGYCEQFCNLCTLVCPTDALVPTSVEEKQKIQVGVAKIDKVRCIFWADNELCLVCNEQCSYNAIKGDEKKRPIVIPEKCTGCGICENKCPVEGESAIIVYANGQQKRLKDEDLEKAPAGKNSAPATPPPPQDAPPPAKD